MSRALRIADTALYFVRKAAYGALAGLIIALVYSALSGPFLNYR